MMKRTQTDGLRSHSAFARWWRGAVLLLLGPGLALAAGCSPLTMLAFFIAPDPVGEPICPLAYKDKETKIAVVVAFENVLVREELVGMDENLARTLTKEIEKGYKSHKPPVTLLSISQLQAFQRRNPHWREMKGSELGKLLKVDFVVNLEIHRMSLFERGSFNGLLNGQAEISVTVSDLSKAEGDEVVYTESYECQYPKGRYHDASDMGLGQFRGKFVERMAKDLMQKFAPYETRDQYDSD